MALTYRSNIPYSDPRPRLSETDEPHRVGEVAKGTTSVAKRDARARGETFFRPTRIAVAKDMSIHWSSLVREPIAGFRRRHVENA